MSMLLNYLKNNYKHLLISSVLKVFFDWLITQKNLNADVIFVNLPRHKYTCNRHGRPIEKVCADLDFVICLPNQLLSSLTSYSASLTERWMTVFKSPNLEIWHRDSYPSNQRPLCLGLSTEQKTYLLQEARKTLLEIVSGLLSQVANTIPPTDWRGSVANVDVTLWVGGQLRGSRIVINRPLLRALQEAVSLAVSDSRFKPIGTDELPDTRIEITLMNSLQIPLSATELSNNQISPELAYVAEHNGQREWLVPAVFNCQRFYHLEHLLSTLYTQKLNCPILPAQPKVYLASVIDFIEPKDANLPAQSLVGPILHKTDASAEQCLSAMAKLGCAYIAYWQEEDGNIPPIYNPLSGKTEQIDWIRLAHASLALVSYGNKISAPEVSKTGRQALTYLQNHIYSRETLSPQTRLLSLLYLNKTAHLLADEDSYKKSTEALNSLLPSVTYEPILYAQLAFFHLRQNTESSLAQALTLTREIQTDLNLKLKNNQSVDLASYCDLIPLLTTCGSVLKIETLKDEAKDLASWYSEMQLANGAFPIHTQTNFCNTRGTAKIFEVLINHKEFSTEQKERLVLWLNDMQYTEENMFFVPAKNRTLTEGGMRHDALNHSVWIDSISHLLLATSANHH